MSGSETWYDALDSEEPDDLPALIPLHELSVAEKEALEALEAREVLEAQEAQIKQAYMAAV